MNPDLTDLPDHLRTTYGSLCRAMHNVTEDDAGTDAVEVIEALTPENKEHLLVYRCEVLAAYHTYKDGLQQLSWLHKHGYLRSEKRLLGLNMFHHGHMLKWYIEHGFRPSEQDMLEAVRQGSRIVMKELLDMGVSIENVPAAAFGTSGNVAMYEDLDKYGYLHLLLRPDALVVAGLHQHEGAVDWLTSNGVQWPEAYKDEVEGIYFGRD